jgi:hypothetical protein
MWRRRCLVVGKTARWSPRAVARSCSSKEEGRGEAAIEVKHTARGASSHWGGGWRCGWDDNLAWNGGFRRPGTGSMSSSECGVDLGLRGGARGKRNGRGGRHPFAVARY